MNEWACRLWSVLWQMGLAQPFKIDQLSSSVAICKCCWYHDRLIPQFVPCMSDADVDQTHSRKYPLCSSCLVALKHDPVQWKCQFGPHQRWEKENIYIVNMILSGNTLKCLLHFFRRWHTDTCSVLQWLQDWLSCQCNLWLCAQTEWAIGLSPVLHDLAKWCNGTDAPSWDISTDPPEKKTLHYYFRTTACCYFIVIRSCSFFPHMLKKGFKANYKITFQRGFSNG